MTVLDNMNPLFHAASARRLAVFTALKDLCKMFLYAIRIDYIHTSHLKTPDDQLASLNCRERRRDRDVCKWDIRLVAQKFVEHTLITRGRCLSGALIADMFTIQEGSLRKRSILEALLTTLVGGFQTGPVGGRPIYGWESMRWRTDPITLQERPEDMEEYLLQFNQRLLGCDMVSFRKWLSRSGSATDSDRRCDHHTLRPINSSDFPETTGRNLCMDRRCIYPRRYAWRGNNGRC